MFDLISEILIKPEGMFNYRNFLDYIQSDKVNFIGINEITKQMTDIFQCSSIFDERDSKIISEQKAIEFLQNKLITQQRNRRKATTVRIDGEESNSSSGMVIAALSFLHEQVAYRVRLCHELQAKSDLETMALKQKLLSESPQLMERVSLSTFSRLGAWLILNNSKFTCGNTHAKATAFLHCFVQTFQNLTALNLEPLG